MSELPRRSQAVTKRSAMFSIEPIDDEAKLTIRIALFADLAAEIVPGYTYNVNVIETGGRVIDGFEYIVIVSFIPTLDIPIELL